MGSRPYLWFVSAGQINLQVPDDAKTGCVPVVVNTANGNVTTAVELEPFAPSFSLLDSQYVAAVIPTPDGSGAYGGGAYDLAGPSGHFSFKTRPVKRGEVVELFGVGFGPTKTSVPAGQSFSGAVATVNGVQILLSPKTGNPVVAPVAFSGLTGAGLYQINITVPLNAATGDLVLRGSVGVLNVDGGGAQTSSTITALLSVQ
jgi:uncharacterized protein (TIGR03437 family)